MRSFILGTNLNESDDELHLQLSKWLASKTTLHPLIQFKILPHKHHKARNWWYVPNPPFLSPVNKLYKPSETRYSRYIYFSVYQSVDEIDIDRKFRDNGLGKVYDARLFLIESSYYNKKEKKLKKEQQKRKKENLSLASKHFSSLFSDFQVINALRVKFYYA